MHHQSLPTQKSFDMLVKEHYDTLSAGKKTVAEYLLKNIDKASYLTLAQIAREAQVSETTVIRLAYSLGFNGFSEMQKSIQMQILGQGEFTRAPEEKDNEDPFAAIIETDIRIIRETLQKLNRHNLQQAIQMLAEADKIYIIGNRTAYPAASWLGMTLGVMRDNVHVVRFTGVQELLGVTPQSAIVAISFPRYVKDTYHYTLNAKSLGAKVIAVTDHELSPIGVISNVTLLANTNRDESGYNSIAPVMSLLNLLAAGLRMKEASCINKRLQKLESLYNQYDNLFE